MYAHTHINNQKSIYSIDRLFLKINKHLKNHKCGYKTVPHKCGYKRHQSFCLLRKNKTSES